MILKRIILFKAVSILACHVFYATISLGQTTNNQLWITYNQQGRFSNKWGYTIDLNHRTANFTKFTSVVSAIRIGGTYFIKDNKRISGGYAWFGQHLQNNEVKLLHENRLWQQYQYFGKKGKFNYFHRIRIDERNRQFLIPYSQSKTTSFFTVRFRYMFQFQGAIIKSKTVNGFGLNWQVADEIMLHAGEGVGQHYFEQNRLIGGVSLSPNRQTDLFILFQYGNQYNPYSEKWLQTNVIRITFNHQIDWRKNL